MVWSFAASVVVVLRSFKASLLVLLPQILQTVRAPGQRQAAGIEVSELDSPYTTQFVAVSLFLSITRWEKKKLH